MKRPDIESNGYPGFPVLASDYGIRAHAGPVDACFYCGRKVGELHGLECVCIVRAVTYRVELDGRSIGSWVCCAPAHWDEETCRFHKNDSSWCASNIRTTGAHHFDMGELPDDECLCSRVVLSVVLMGESVYRASEAES